MKQKRNAVIILLVSVMALTNLKSVAIADDTYTADRVTENPRSMQIDIDGAWFGVAQTHDGNCTWNLTSLQFNDSLSGKLIGSGSAMQDSGPSRCGGNASGQLSGNYDPEDGDLTFGWAGGVFRGIRFDGTARDGKTMDGTWMGVNRSGTWALSR